jgi:hypothetical protein
MHELAGPGGSDLGFLAAVDALADRADPGAQPFDDWFRVPEDEAWEHDFFACHYGFDGEDDQGWRRVETDWLGVAGRFALQLDADTNNACLALAFELSPSGRVLLFPGDAQPAQWRSWAERRWRVGAGPDARAVTAADLLARTAVYKVGHHGSHTGTPREHGLDWMTGRELTALLSVDRAAAKMMDWKMPFPPLDRRLREKTGGRVIDSETGVPAGPSTGVSPQEWTAFIDAIDVQPDWIDYRVEM